MLIKRALTEEITDKLLNSNKIIVILGARQVGKTTLVNEIIKNLPLKKNIINADEERYLDTLSSKNSDKLKLLVSGYDLLFIDEAQRIPDIGINLKILHDTFPNLKIITTGSSSLELANKVKEPLTGRTSTFNLLPISTLELSALYNKYELHNKLEEFLIYGLYPDILQQPNGQTKYKFLKELSISYLYKDIFEISSIRNPKKIQDLLTLLAFQISSKVSMSELANNLGMSKETVESYIDLLEKSFIIFRLSGYSKNLRKEVTKMDKIYFYDLGIRNIIINNFNPLNYRDDIGKLWENFVILERKKKLEYSVNNINSYFWRTYTGAELDYIEEKNNTLAGFEIKYKKTAKTPPQTWLKTYPNSSYLGINQDNYLDFIL